MKTTRNLIAVLITLVSAIIAQAQPNWSSVVYTNSTSMIATVEINSTPANEGDILGVFVGTECRAIANIELKDGIAYAMANIQGETVETASFKLFKAADNIIIETSITTQTKPGEAIGSASEPLLVSFSETVTQSERETLYSSSDELMLGNAIVLNDNIYFVIANDPQEISGYPDAGVKWYKHALRNQSGEIVKLDELSKGESLQQTDLFVTPAGKIGYLNRRWAGYSYAFEGTFKTITSDSIEKNEIVFPAANWFLYPRIAFDNTGKPHISSFSAAGYYFVYHNFTTSWQNRYIGGYQGGWIGNYAVAMKDNILYTIARVGSGTDNTHTLRLFIKDAQENWSTVDVAGNMSESCDIKFSPDNTMYILFTQNNELKLAKRESNGTFTVETIVNQPDIHHRASIAFQTNGNLLVAYQAGNSSYSKVEVFEKFEKTWQSIYIDEALTAGTILYGNRQPSIIEHNKHITLIYADTKNVYSTILSTTSESKTYDMFEIQNLKAKSGSKINITVNAGIVPTELAGFLLEFNFNQEKLKDIKIVNSHISLDTVYYYNGKILWDSPSMENLSIAPGEKLFDIEATVLAEPNEELLITFSNISASDYQGKSLSLNSNSAIIEVLGFDISGTVTDDFHQPVARAKVYLKSSSNSYYVSTDDYGKYLFSNVYPDTTIIISVEQNDLNITNLDASDVVLYRRALLGITPFTTPAETLKAKWITGNIDIAALVVLKQVILGNIDSFPTGKSWIFTPSSYTLIAEDITNNSFETKLVINDLNANLINQDFTAYAVGDLTNEAENMKRSTNNIYYAGQLRNISGELWGIPIIANSNYQEIPIWQAQFELPVDIGYYQIISGKLLLDNGDYRIKENQIRFLVEDKQGLGQSFQSEDTLFTIIGSLNDLTGEVLLNTADFPAFYLNSHLQRYGFETETNYTTTVKTFSNDFCRVYPNPSSNKVTIESALLKKIEIFSINGIKVKSISGNITNSIDIDVSNLQQGIYFLHISTDNGNTIHKISVSH